MVFPALPPQSGHGGAALLAAHARMPSDKWNGCMYHWLPKSALRVIRIDGWLLDERDSSHESVSAAVSVLYTALLHKAVALSRGIALKSCSYRLFAQNASF